MQRKISSSSQQLVCSDLVCRWGRFGVGAAVPVLVNNYGATYHYQSIGPSLFDLGSQNVETQQQSRYSNNNNNNNIHICIAPYGRNFRGDSVNSSTKNISKYCKCTCQKYRSHRRLNRIKKFHTWTFSAYILAATTCSGTIVLQTTEQLYCIILLVIYYKHYYYFLNFNPSSNDPGD